MKVWILADSTNSYCCNLQVYTGRRGNAREVNQGQRVVLELTQHLSGSGRHVTADNFFTSLALVRSLLSRQLTYCGTIRRNKGEIPVEMQASRNREVHSSLFGFQQDTTLVSYVPRQGKSVILLSSLHHDNSRSEDEMRKPVIILDYNSYKAGVDTLDQVVRCYSSKRKSNRWPFSMFCNILDIASYNAYILYVLMNPDFANRSSHRRRLFLMELALSLLQLPPSDDEVSLEPSAATASSRVGPTRIKGRCQLCPRGNDRKVRQKCIRCEKFACNDHARPVCTDCM